MNQLFIQTLAQCIFHYMDAAKIRTFTEFNEQNNFTPLKTALLPFMIASAAEDMDAGFKLYEPWTLQTVLPLDMVKQPKVYVQRLRFHNSPFKFMPFIDFPEHPEYIGYQNRYRTIAPEGFVEKIKPLFPDWKEESKLKLSDALIFEFKNISKNGLIENSLELLAERDSNPITFEVKLFSCLLDYSFSFYIARLVKDFGKEQHVPLKRLIETKHIFARDPKRRILCP